MFSDRINLDSGYCALSCFKDKAHARRRFFEAIKALPKAEQKSPTAAHEGVRRIDELYTIEREAKTLTLCAVRCGIVQHGRVHADHARCVR